MAYRVEVALPELDFYSLDDVIVAIATAETPCSHVNEVDRTYQCPITGEITTVSGNICPSCGFARKASVRRLRKHFARLMKESGIITRNWKMENLPPPPKEDHDLPFWATTSYLAKDAIEYLCKKDCIHIAFYSGKSTKHHPSAEDPIPGQTSAPETQNPTIPVPNSNSAKTNSTNTEVPCIELFRVEIRRITVEVAWLIERDTGRKAKQPEVMKRLREMAKKAEEHPPFIGATPKGVEWKTSKETTATFTPAACRRTLSDWHGHRARRAPVGDK